MSQNQITNASVAAQITKCTKNHSGNKTLHKLGRGRFAGFRECAGCGQIYTLTELCI